MACLCLAALPGSMTFVGSPPAAPAAASALPRPALSSRLGCATWSARVRLAEPLVCMRAQRPGNGTAPQVRTRRESSFGSSSGSRLDAMRARAGVLRQQVYKQQQELNDLEQEIEKAVLRTQRIGSARARPSRGPIQKLTRTLDRSLTQGFAGRWVRTFAKSVDMLGRKLGRVRAKEGPNNARWQSVGQYVQSQTVTATRIVGALVKNPTRLNQLLDPEVPSLLPHMPAILARLDKVLRLSVCICVCVWACMHALQNTASRE